MAVAASLFSMRFMRANRFSQAIDAFFGKEKPEKKTAEKSLEKDLIELSPANQLRQTIAQFKQTKSVSAELNVKMTVSTEKSLEQGGSADPKLQRDLDLMLRMFSRDEEHYEELKTRFEELVSMAETQSEQLSNVEQPELPTHTTAGMTQAEMSASLARRNSYELNLKFRNNASIEEQTRIELEELGIIKVDPLVLDLTGEGINLTKAGEGARFDVNADGRTDQTAWVRGNTAMLVYDKNGNGIIDDGSEMFGDQNGAANGFAELAKHDANSDGRIDRLDPVFKALKLYRDLNGDGKIASNELATLPEMGIKALNLNFIRAAGKINGNDLVLSGSFEREDGSTGHLADVLLGYRNL